MILVDTSGYGLIELLELGECNMQKKKKKPNNYGSHLDVSYPYLAIKSLSTLYLHSYARVLRSTLCRSCKICICMKRI